MRRWNRRPAALVIAAMARRLRLPACLVAAGLVGLAASPVPSAGVATEQPSRPPPCWHVLLRMELVGGLATLDRRLDGAPVFTLYADGTVVYRPLAGIDAALSTTILSPRQAEELLDHALDVAGLRSARATDAGAPVEDAATTIFTIDAKGVRKSVAVHGLGLGAPGPDHEAQEGLAELAGRLADFDRYLPTDAVVSTYQPPAYRAVFNEEDPEASDLIPWPWIDLSPDALGSIPGVPAMRVADLRAEQAALLAELPSGGVSGIGIILVDGRAYRVSMRPLLPDEIEPTQEATDPG